MEDKDSIEDGVALTGIAHPRLTKEERLAFLKSFNNNIITPEGLKAFEEQRFFLNAYFAREYPDEYSD